jgi:hypothetical protein
MFSFTPLPLYPRAKSPRYPFDRRLGGPQSRSGRRGEEKILDPGRAVAEAVSRWLPTAAAWVRFRAACGVCGGQSGTGAGFLRVLRFPLPIIPPISPSS